MGQKRVLPTSPRALHLSILSIRPFSLFSPFSPLPPTRVISDTSIPGRPAAAGRPARRGWTFRGYLKGCANSARSTGLIPSAWLGL